MRAAPLGREGCAIAPAVTWRACAALACGVGDVLRPAAPYGRKKATAWASRSVKELLSARRDLIDCPSSLVL